MDTHETYPRKLIPLGDLVTQAYALFVPRIHTFIKLNALFGLAWVGIVVIVVLGLLPYALTLNQTYLAALVVSLPLAGYLFYLSLRLQLGTFFIASHPPEVTRVKAYYTLSRGRVLPYMWIGLVGSLMMVGGLVLFIIPGLIVSLAGTFAVWIYMLENERGMTAIKKSFRYVHGRWWGILGRMLFIALISQGFISILHVLAMGSNLLFGIFQSVYFVVSIGYSTCYFYLLYKNAAATADPLYRPKQWYITTLLALGTLAFSLMALIVLALPFVIILR